LANRGGMDDTANVAKNTVGVIKVRAYLVSLVKQFFLALAKKQLTK
jgi:hypothetical protein